MRRSLFLFLLLFALSSAGVVPGAAMAAERDTLVCGTLTAHERSSAERTGSVTVGGTRIVLAAEPLYSVHPGTQERLKVGTAVCFSATYNAAGEAMQYLVNALPDILCGKVSSIERPSATQGGSVRLEWLGIGTFTVAAGVELGPASYPGQPCFRASLDSAGRAQIVGRVLTVADRTAVHLNACGVVAEWTAPTRVSAGLLRHEVAGTIRIGSRVYTIARGTEYSTVNATPVVGEPTCLAASLDAGGRIIQYAAQPGMPSPYCASRPEEYRAPTAAADGAVVVYRSEIFLHTADSFRYRIPAGTAMPPDAASGEYCWVLTLDMRGDAVVTAARRRPSVQGAATAPRTGPAIGTLPSTATSAQERPWALRVCGRIAGFKEATATEEGALVIGTRSYVIAPGGRYLEMHVRMRVGDARCILAWVDGEGRLTEFWAHAADPDRYGGWPIPALRDFGVVTEFVAPTTKDEGRIVLDAGASSYPVARSTALPVHVLGHEIGIAMQLQPDGDAEVIGWSAGSGMGAQPGPAAYDGVCGRVAAIAIATPAAPGTVTAGDRTFVVAAGVYLGWGGVSQWGAGPIVGHDVCLSGVRASDGRLLSYAITDMFPMNAGLCGQVLALEADRMHLRLASDTVGMSGRHRIRPGTALPERFPGRTCFGRLVAADGVAEIVRVHGFDPVPQSPTGGGPRTIPPISVLPSTSTH